jgi:UDP-glucuronate 4-epimerase
MTIESNVGIPSKFSPVHEEEEENDDFVIGDSFEVGSTDSADTAATGLASASISNSSKVVLVTGGAGFIGSHVADFLLARGDKVIIVDEMNDYYDIRLKQGNLDYLANKYPTISHGTTKSNDVNRDNARCIIYKGDICNESFISLIFQVEKPNYICHLAARAGVRASILDPYIYVHSNIEGTTRLLDLARQYMCVNFVYASSSSVYGCSEKSILSESDVVEKPVSPYAATKKAW